MELKKPLRECCKGVSQELRKLLTCSECSTVLARGLGISPGAWTHNSLSYSWMNDWGFSYGLIRRNLIHGGIG